MKTAAKTIHGTTLGDLIGAAFDRAQQGHPDPKFVAASAARDVQAVLDRMNRWDLIRALVAADGQLHARTMSTAAAGKRRVSMTAPRARSLRTTNAAA